MSRTKSSNDRPSNNGAAAVDRLRGRIDSGVTGEKVGFSDPAAAPLGTDAEAAGATPTLDQVRKAEGALDYQPEADGKKRSLHERQKSQTGMAIAVTVFCVIALAGLLVLWLR